MKKIYSLLTAVVMMAVGSVNALADETLNLSPTDATYINAGNTETNYSTTGVLYANFSKVDKGVLTDQLSAYGGSDITIVKFNASTIPAGATIKSASLTFKSKCTVSGKNSQLAIVPIGTDWKASTVTWSNMDLSANGSNKVDLAWSNTTESTQTYDAKNVLSDDDDKIVAFAVFTNTGRQQEVSSFNLAIVYTEETVSPAGAITINYIDSENSQIGTQEVSVEGKFAGESINVYWPKYIENAGKYYIMEESSCSASVELTASAQTKNINYKEADNSIIYYIEGEQLENNTGKTIDLNFSNGGYSAVAGGKKATLTTLTPGSYKFYGYLAERGDRGMFIRNADNADNSANIIAFIDMNKSSAVGEYSVEFTITENTNLQISGFTTSKGSTNQSSGIDYIYIQKVGDASYTRSTTTGKYGTICLPYAPEVTGATLYSAAIEGEYVTLTEVTSPVAGTPYIYQATADEQTFAYNGGDIVSAPVAAAPLTGVFTATAVPAGAYVMQTQGDVQQFYQVESGKQPTLSANKAYLTISGGAKALNIGTSEETAIKAIDALTSGEAKIYDINGRQLNSLQKGINIVNGVKVLVK